MKGKTRLFVVFCSRLLKMQIKALSIFNLKVTYEYIIILQKIQSVVGLGRSQPDYVMLQRGKQRNIKRGGLRD